MRFIILLALTFSVTPAHAGPWQRFCARYVVDDDPYVYQGASSEYLAELYKIEAAKTYWIHGKSRLLGILGAQLRANATVRPLSQEIVEMLENYREFEL